MNLYNFQNSSFNPQELDTPNLYYLFENFKCIMGEDIRNFIVEVKNFEPLYLPDHVKWFYQTMIFSALRV
jgi:hypothetical protein